MPKNNSGKGLGNRIGLVLVALGALAVACLGVFIWRMSPPPQIGNDPEVFRTVDALFTAVTSKDEQRLSECEQRLQGYRQAGKLPADAADALDTVIQKARSGSWQKAAERLYAYIQGQRREG